MTARLLDDLIKRSEALTPEEQLRLIAHLADRAREAYGRGEQRRQWGEIGGAATHPMVGEDAQEWVSRTRRESDG